MEIVPGDGGVAQHEPRRPEGVSGNETQGHQQCLMTYVVMLYQVILSPRQCLELNTVMLI